MRLLIFLISTLLAASALESTYKVTEHRLPSECSQGCLDGLTKAVFSDIDPALDYYAGQAGSELLKTSLAACGLTYCSEAEQQAGWAYFSSTVAQYGDGSVQLEPLAAVLDRVRAMDQGFPTINVFTDEGMIVNVTTIPDLPSWRAGLKTEMVWDQQMTLHHTFGWTMFLLAAVCVAVGMLNRLNTWVLSRWAGQPFDKTLGRNPGMLSNLRTHIKRKVLLPALLGYRHAQPWYGWCTITLYVVLNVVFSSVHYPTFGTNLYWSDLDLQHWRYVADRTGILALYNMVLLWALAGRNDVLLWMTGWSFSSMNLFHRWVARVAVVQAIVHSAAWTWQYKGTLSEPWKELYWRTGVFATILMCLLLPLSAMPVRRWYYEFFLLIHIFFAIVILVMMYYHVMVYEGEYNAWIWACVAVWLFDRGLRVVRLCICSLHALRRGANATATLSSTDGLVRLSVQTPTVFKPRPGTYYFVYLPRLTPFTPWQNHPFTLASWTEDPRQLEFLVGPRRGATKQLVRRLDRSEGSIRLGVLLEGPYGTSHDLSVYDHVLLVAGGSGITAILPYIFALGNTATRVSVVWAVKTTAYAADVLAHELANPKANTAVTLHVTTEGAAVSSEITPVVSNQGASSEADVDEKSQSVDYKPLNPTASDSTPGTLSDIKYGRPVMAEALDKAIRALRGWETLGVMVCGPGSMNDDMRGAVCSSMGTGEAKLPAERLDYFEEAFGW